MRLQRKREAACTLPEPITPWLLLFPLLAVVDDDDASKDHIESLAEDERVDGWLLVLLEALVGPVAGLAAASSCARHILTSEWASGGERALARESVGWEASRTGGVRSKRT